ncbi:serine carboxypeptidase S28 family protein [Striga asiatica]|uniref:Serine carboxypeptidase S28 family protein n=1 Tax=Striga asiatica TaxID=4170 RepID=A0A5A7PR28_STRAF|nr:serine carboxypeptidase S28 family protein [Striga asiatica]
MKLAGHATAWIPIAISLLILMAASVGMSAPTHLRLPASGSNNYLTTEEHWLDQTLDHFSPYTRFDVCSTCNSVSVNLQAAILREDHRQFKQRYYEYLDHFRVPDGPIFLKICGESTCNGIVNDYVGVLAKKFGAAVVSPEHRYYGKSSPFQSLTTKNLRYLSSKQALFDLAVFRKYYQASTDIILCTLLTGSEDSLNTKLNRSNIDNPWFIFGVSYAGALSAWFRLKFPHLTCGSLASSAVVLAVYNFTEFDKQIGESAGPECKAVLQEITQLVDQKLGSNEKALKNLFSAAELKNDGDFMYFLADAAVTAFQYGNPDKLCIPLVEAKKAGNDLVEAYATYVKEYYIKSFGVSVETYNQEHLKNTTLASGTSDRLWWFQVCTEVAYFQVAPSNDSIRSSKVDTSYHLDLCKNVFGEGIYPDVTATNIYYGGTKIAVPSYIMTCHNCGHGADIRGCPQSPLAPEGDAKNCSSPEAVNKVRQHIIAQIDLWLSECQNSGRSSI